MDKEQDWLSRERLELYVIVNLAHGRDAQTFPINTQPELPRFRVLKDAIDSGELSALPGTRGNPNADAMSRVGRPVVRSFCQDWSQARGKPLLGLDSLEPPSIPDCLGGQR